MLVNLRKFAGTWVMAIFSFLIIISFAVWGIGDIFRGRTSNAVATIEGTEIPAQVLEREVRNELERLRRLFGQPIDIEQARALGVIDRALDSIIARALYDLEAERLGLAVGDDVVRDAIAATPAFRNAAGQFDPAVFLAALRAGGLDEPTYVALLRNDIRRTQLIDSLTGPVHPPAVLVDSLYRYREERRVAEYFAIEPSAIGDIAAPDEATLESFHKEHADLFTAPETRALTYIAVRAEDLIDEVTVSEEELRAEYEARRASFAQPERREVEQILVSDKEKAERIAKRLAAGEDFATVAAEEAGLGAADIALGTITRDTLFPEVADAVFSLPEGGISEPVKSPFGWHIFRVNRILPASEKPFAEVRDELARELALNGALDVLYDFTKRLDDALAGGASLEDAANQLGLTLGQVPAVDREGRDASGEPVPGLPATEEFLSTAFTLGPGETSLVVEAKDGTVFVVRVDGVTPAALRPFAEVRDQVLAAWRETEAKRLAAARAKEAAARIDGGADIAAVADAFGAEVRVSRPFRRDGADADPMLAAPVIEALFQITPGAAVSGGGPGDASVVARLSTIIEANPADKPEAVASLRDELRTGFAGDLATEYRDWLQTRYSVEIDRDAVARLF